MKHKKNKLCATLLLGLGLITAHAQEAATASGGDATGSGGSAAYSVGQVVYTTYTGTSGSVAQGVQQHYKITIVTGLDEMGINLHFFAYPNPTTDLLTLQVENPKGQSFWYHLYDLQGILKRNEKVTGNNTTVKMGDLATGIYFLRVTNKNKVVKSFKIIKN